MIKYLKTILILSFSLSHSAYAADVNIFDRLNLRNDIFIATQKVRPYLFDEKVLQRLDAWVTHPGNTKYITDCQFQLRPFFKATKILAPLCYFLRQDDLAKRAQYFDFVKLYLLEYQAIFFELSNDPRFSPDLQSKAQKFYNISANLSQENLKNCFYGAMRVDYSKGFSFSPFQDLAHCLNDSFEGVGNSPKRPVFAIDLQSEFGIHPGHVVSATGWIGGNKASYLYNNDYSEELSQYLDERFDLMASIYPLDGRGSFESMRKEDPKKIFTVEEGFESVAEHPVWAQKSPSIFGETIASINAAKETIFVDIFFLGGTMGASLAKHLVKLLDEKPRLKILILRDLDNHYGHDAEMLPVFNFLQAYSFNHPDRLIISKSHITSHSSGLPALFQDVITDEFIKATGLQDHLSLYGRAVSDHSKVMVIDGKTATPIAFVGSKNWTDSSGSVCYDEVVKIVGPAAAVIQDDYYFDMFFALEREFRLDNDKGDRLLDHFLDNGWAKYNGPTNISRQKKVAIILQPFDLLNRDESFKTHLTNKKVLLSEQGSTLLRAGYNNIDSSHNNVLDQVIQLVLAAKKNIYIKDQYLFDRNVVLALLRVKAENPAIDIRVLLDPIHRAPIAGMPNLLYADVLSAAGIKIRFKKVLENDRIAQEYHMKTISADGQYVISGSANKDQTTMYGSFREEQVDIFDKQIASAHDKVFLEHWENSSTSDFESFNFEVPLGIKGLDGEPLTPPEFIALIRNLISILFDDKTY